MIFNHRMSADQAAVTDECRRTDDAVGSEKNAFADLGFRMDDRRRVALPPLREAKTLLIEIFEQFRHAHGDVANREATGVAVLGGIEVSAHMRRDD